MPSTSRYHAASAFGSFALKNTPPMPVTCPASGADAGADRAVPAIARTPMHNATIVRTAINVLPGMWMHGF